MTNKDMRINLFVIVPLLLTVILIGGGITYALFTKTVNTDKEIIVGTGTKYIGIYGEGKNDIQLGKRYTFTVENRGVVSSGYELYLEHDGSNTISPVDIICNITSTSSSIASPNIQVTADKTTLVVGDLVAGEKDTITIELTGDTSLIYRGKIKLRYVDYRTPDSPKNRNIVAIYTYNDVEGSDNYCVSGDEATCQYSKCYKEESEGSCPAGTIVKYKVNSTTTKDFHVLFDRGNVLVMQTRTAVLNMIKWNENNVNSEGPITILAALENATENWNNVHDLTYTLGGASLTGDTMYTGCNNNLKCETNTYTLSERTAKARLLTLQEATSFGCGWSNNSCPKYLTPASGSYWTSSSYSSNEKDAFLVYSSGFVSRIGSAQQSGTFAVVEISK